MSLNRIQITSAIPVGAEDVLTPDALAFLLALSDQFEATRQQRLAARHARDARLQAGELPDFLPETQSIRDADWQVAPIPADLQDRRVEITGPVDRKMVINALNSGAHVFMADLEDANSPTWSNNLLGQVNLSEAIRRTIAFTSPEGKQYKLNDNPAVLFVRARGWHLVERHVLIDGQPISASLFDFGLYFLRNAAELLARGSGPYFYLPKLESHLEARLWNDVFVFAQNYCGIPQGSIRSTVLIETILGSFEMDEILYELRDHSAGLNCGRWDYIFSFIKKLGHRPELLMPNRAQVTMESHFLKSYVQLLIQTCHRRGIHAMGGMAAQIPIKNDAEANAAALEKVRLDKLREVRAGHDGTWVAHPGLIPIARQVFDEGMPTPNQIHVPQPPVQITAADLLKSVAGTITLEGLRQNVDIGLQYLEAWLGGSGCVPIYNLMEDAATAEISRSQVWQWVRHGAKADDGTLITAELARAVVASESARLRATREGHFETAAAIMADMVTGHDCAEFLTLPAYDRLVD